VRLVSAIAGMRVQEAKDFLVQQAKEQAQLEGVPLAERISRKALMRSKIQSS